MLKDEEFLAVGLVILTGFLYLNVSRDIGTFFSIAAVAYLTAVLSKRTDWFVQFIKRGRFESDAAIGAGMVVVWLVLASFLLTYIKPVFTFSVIDTLQQLYLYTDIPVLSADPNVRFIVFGIAIPIIETTLFLSLVLMFWAKLAKVKIQWHPMQSPNFMKMLLVCALVGITASLFHMSARMMADFALIIDFVFFFLSSLIVFRFKELLGAGLFHVLTNSLILLVGGA